MSLANCLSAHKFSEKDAKKITALSQRIRLKNIKSKMSADDAGRQAVQELLDEALAEQKMVIELVHEALGLPVADVPTKPEKVDTSAERVQKTAEIEQVGLKAEANGTYLHGFQTVNSGELGEGIESNNAVEEKKKEILASGKVMPISISRDGFIVDGEHRYKALMELGVKNIPVFVGEQSGASGRLVNGYRGLPVEVDIPKGKETDQGTKLYSKSSIPVTNPHTLSSLQPALINAFTGKLRNAVSALFDAGKARVVTAQQAAMVIGKDALFAENGLQSNHEVPNPSGQSRSTPIDGPALAELRRAAAGIEAPDKGITFTVSADGKAVVTGPARTKVPARFQQFADEHGLTLVVHRRESGNFGKTHIDPGANTTVLGDKKYYGEAIPIEYRESGALYFGELGDNHLDRTGSTRFSRDNIKYDGTGTALAFFNPADGISYFIADNISADTSSKELRGLAIHEISVHAKHLGKSDTEFQAILKQVETMRKMGNKKVVAAFEAAKVSAEEYVKAKIGGQDSGAQFSKAQDQTETENFKRWSNGAPIKTDGFKTESGNSGQQTDIPKLYGIWNSEVGDGRYAKTIHETDIVSESVVKKKMRDVTLGAEWPFDPVSVKRGGSGPYMLEDGHHRIEIARRLGMRIIPAEMIDQRAFGHTRPVNTYIEIDADGTAKIVQPDNESLPPIKVTVPDAMRAEDTRFSRKQVSEFDGTNPDIRYSADGPPISEASLSADYAKKRDEIIATEGYQKVLREELAGYVIQQNPDLPIVQKLIARFRALIRAIGKSMPVLQRMKWFAAMDELTVDDLVYMSHSALANSRPEAMGERAGEFAPMFSKSVAGDATPFTADIRERIATAEIKNQYASKARDWISDALIPSEKGSFNWWHKTVGTQLHKARTNPHFGKVFDLGQKLLNDVSMIAQRSEALAPNILPRSDTLQGFFKTGLSKADNTLISYALTSGTLENGADPRSGKVWSDAELKDRFGMNKEQIGYYREARAAIDKSLEDMALSEIIRDMRVAKIDRALYEPLAQIDAPLSKVAEAIDKTLGKMQARLEAANHGNADRVAELRQRIQSHVTAVTELQEAGYAPLMRFGRYTVTGHDAEGEVTHFFMFESKSEALRAKVALKKDSEVFNVTSGEYNDEQFKLFKGISPSTIEAFANHSELGKDKVFQDFLKMATANRSALKRMIHRQGTAGFADDASRSLASFILSNARKASQNINSAALSEAVLAIPKEMGDVAKEATRLVEYINDPGEAAAKLRGFMFAQYLGGSLAAGLVNMTQPVLMTFPYLSQYGTKNAATHMAAGLKDVKNWFIGRDVKDADLQQALTLAQNRGITAPQEIFQMIAAAQGESGSFYGHKFMRLWGANFAMTEAFNRVLTFSSAYRVGRDMSKEDLKKAGFKDVFEFAERAVEDTQGIYNKGNRPDWARSAVGATVFTFKQYSISYLEFMRRMWGDGVIPKKQFVLAAALLLLAAGAGGLPGADDLDDLIETIGHWLGYATNAKKWKNEVLTSLLGEDAANFALHGVSALPFMPLDVHARLGMANVIPGTGMFNPTRINKSREVTEVAGIAGSFASSILDGMDNVAKGNFSGAAKNILPKAVKDAYMAYEMSSTGEYRDISGRKVMDATMGDALVKAIGFQPAEIASESRKMRDIRADIEIVNAKKSELNSQIARAIVDHDAEARAEAMQELRQWNLDNPDMRIKINFGAINRRVKEMRATRMQRFIKATPKELRDRTKAALQDNG